MNYTKSLVGALAALAAGACMFGQTVDTTSAGLLGKRYASAGLFAADFRDSPIDTGIGAQLGVNLPVAANLDVAFSYEYVHIDDSLVDANGNALGATARYHTLWSGVKPFADATLGYTWLDADNWISGFEYDEFFWDLGVGVEIPVANATAIIGRVGYSELFDNDFDGSWNFTVGASHWFSPRLAGTIQVTFAAGGATMLNVFDAETGELQRSVQIGAE